MNQSDLIEKAGTGATEVKQLDVQYEIHPLIAKRWSPRSFSERPVSEDQVRELVEAARWSASSMNEQPWRYAYAMRGTEGFDDLVDHLSPGNQPWAKNAAILIVMMARTTFSSNGRPNWWALHDLGIANAQLVLQAAHRDIYTHLMGGFDRGGVKEYLGIPDELEPVCIAALGYLGRPDQLEEPYYSRELANRTRKPIDDILTAI